MDEHSFSLLRRTFLARSALGLSGAAVASLFSRGAHSAEVSRAPAGQPGLPGLPHFAPRARRAIYLFMSGAPSQLDMFDHKPAIADKFDQDLPPSVRKNQRLTGMTASQARFPLAPSLYRFARHGRNGTWVSELLPHTARIVDDVAIVRSMHTDAINHDPGVTFLMSGGQIPGRPSLGAWLSYGLGAETQDLPAFVVLHSTWSGPRNDQPIFSRLWGAGFLPSRHQGVALRSQGDAVLYLTNPDGVDRASRRRLLDALGDLNREHLAHVGDPEIATRIAQYEMAFRMQASVPELTQLKDEPASVRALYGPDVERPGTFAANCLLARRMAERGVRFVQVFHRGWDHHSSVPTHLPKQCRDIDQAAAGLITDLKQRGMLDDTLVVWGGEFGRTVYCQGPLTREDYGRDHHPRCFTMWLAGGGIRAGVEHGETDDFGYNIVRDPVHVHDLNATILRCLGIDHERLTFRHQGREFRLTDVHGTPVEALLVDAARRA